MSIFGLEKNGESGRQLDWRLGFGVLVILLLFFLAGQYVAIPSEPTNNLREPFFDLQDDVDGDPSVLKIFPEDRKLQPDGEIILIFSHPMVASGQAPDSHEPGFLGLSPPVRGQWTWHNSKTLVFTPSDGFFLATRYRLKVTGVANTLDGRALSWEMDELFETDRLQLYAGQFLPSGESDELEPVSVSQGIVLTFNQEVSIRSLQQHLTINNKKGKHIKNLDIVKGGSGQYVYEVRPVSGKWSYDEEYAVELSSELMPAIGNLPLGEDHKFSFGTEVLFAVNPDISSGGDQHLLSFDDNSFEIELKEPISLKKLQQSLSFIPQASFKIEQKAEGVFSISLPELSQKRENIDMYVDTSINPRSTEYISEPVVTKLSRPPNLAFQLESTPTALCLTSSTPISLEFSSVRWDQKSSLPGTLQSVTSEQCLTSVQYPYAYQVFHHLLQPESTAYFLLNIIDGYGQRLDRSEQLFIKPLSVEGKVLQAISQGAEHRVSKSDDIALSFATKNLTRVNVELCKMAPKSAVLVEVTLDEKWDGFRPSSEVCEQYRSQNLQLDPAWYQLQQHRIQASQLVENIEEGLYYVAVRAPEALIDGGDIKKIYTLFHYSTIGVLSKRADSSLVWVLDEASHLPIQGAKVSFYTSEGEFLKEGVTDEYGVNFDPANNSLFEFISVEHQGKELLHSPFSDKGFEPERFGVKRDVDESNFVHHFFLEPPNLEQSIIRGALILKEVSGEDLATPMISRAVVTLQDDQEEFLWRQYEPFDSFGNLFFRIQPQQLLTEGTYLLSVCVGLHQGICQGSSFSTGVEMRREGRVAKADIITGDVDATFVDHPMIDWTLAAEVSPGDRSDLILKNLQSGRPVLITVERDAIFFHHVLVPESDSAVIPVTFSQVMIPEAMVSVTQLRDGKFFYDLLQVPISRESKRLSHELELTSGEFSRIVFEVPAKSSYVPDLLPFFYPRKGTEVITASNLFSRLGQNAYQNWNDDVPNPSSTTIIEGRLVGSGGLLGADQQHLFLLQGLDGSFTSYVSRGRENKVGLSEQILAPHFIRSSDQLHLRLDVKNNHPDDQVVHLEAGSPDLSFISNPELFFSVAGHGSKSIPLVVQLGEGNTNERNVLNLRLESSDLEVRDISMVLPLAESLPPPLRNPRAVFLESTQGSGSIPLPEGFSQPLLGRTIIAPTPISYVTESLKNFLKDDPEWIDATIQKMSLLSSYSQLLTEGGQGDEELSKMLNTKKFVQQHLSQLSLEQYFRADKEEIEKGDDLFLAVQLARALASLEQAKNNLPPPARTQVVNYLKQQLDLRLRERLQQNIELARLSAEDALQELELIHALASLTPAGIPHANNWYQLRESLGNEALVLLLLSFEDYRDYQVAGTTYKIEELTQLLKGRARSKEGQRWLESSFSANEHVSDFLLTSRYLEALVRQASTHSDIPAIITWLISHKYDVFFQSHDDQFA
ncbi:MAG: hypothetical protein Q8P95_04555, partial [bacterium]|nr:hypothetical protein [bacterium]